METAPAGFVVARDDYLFLLDAKGKKFEGWVFVLEDRGVKAVIVLLSGQMKVIERG